MKTNFAGLDYALPQYTSLNVMARTRQGFSDPSRVLNMDHGLKNKTKHVRKLTQGMVVTDMKPFVSKYWSYVYITLQGRHQGWMAVTLLHSWPPDSPHNPVKNTIILFTCLYPCSLH